MVLPPVVTTTVNDGRLVVQSSLLGQGAEFATAQDLSIGRQVPTSGPGTVTATIASADFFQEGLTQPEGADLGIAFGEPQRLWMFSRRRWDCWGCQRQWTIGYL